MPRRLFPLFALLLLASLILPAGASRARQDLSYGPIMPESSGSEVPNVRHSHRLIVRLNTPSLSESKLGQDMKVAGGRLNVNSPAAQAYVAQLKVEQANFIQTMKQALPGSAAATYINERGVHVQAAYQLTINAVAVDVPRTLDLGVAHKQLSQLKGVASVHFDYAYEPTLYDSLELVNAPAMWNHPEIGGQENAGEGIKVASMDGGLHKDAPMFDGTGYSYPPGYPKGLTSNTNGKIIVSRAYFRSWDPPAPGDENPWPGVAGTSHGTHTGSTAAGNAVTANYLGLELPISGVAPRAWLMSYRVFYESVTSDGSFYTIEGIAALEDIVRDGADVVNNSWGGGPTSAGGVFDPLDLALLNVVSSGIFVSMSAGNAGPGMATMDHPSDDYISVAATTKGSALASGRFNISAPEPVSPTLQSRSFLQGSFGGAILPGMSYEYDYLPAALVGDGTNFEGCNPWPAGTFTGKAAVISRGVCDFSLKAAQAQDAGAVFVVIYNHATGGEALQGMGAGARAGDVTIPAIFVQRSTGLGAIAWYQQHGAASKLELDTFAYMVEDETDTLIGFSSRGPGVGDVLKPDIAAPGVNILAQGYTPNATGEARHLGYGQVSGTSMAAPHVTGAAAMIRQIHPDWTPAMIKSALMSTSKYMEIYNQEGNPAQPLDMGAGRLDMTRAANPGVILDPPSLSFGTVLSNTTNTRVVAIKNITGGALTYDISTLYTGDGFAAEDLTALPGFTLSASEMLLAPGETRLLTVTFNTATSQGYGDNQGYVVLDGPGENDAHFPVWGRIRHMDAKDVLVIDNDASGVLPPGFANYSTYYTSTLETLGLSYDVWNADLQFGNDYTIPPLEVLLAYKSIIYYTGDHFQPDGSFNLPTALTAIDQDRLMEYLNNGRTVIAMGQNMSAVLQSDDPDTNTTLYSFGFGAEWVQESVSKNQQPTLPFIAHPEAPEAFQNLLVDLRGGWNSTPMSGANEVPTPVTTNNTGTLMARYNETTNVLNYQVTLVITNTEPVTLTAAHIHLGAFDESGGVLYNLTPASWPTTTAVSGTISFQGSVTLTEAHEQHLDNNNLYVNVHTSRNPGGELRAQLSAAFRGDAAGNQSSVDEILVSDPDPDTDDWGLVHPFTQLLRYPSTTTITEEGTVAVMHRAQPSLEFPEVTYFGRSVYTTFGLEGVNNTTGYSTRAELLDALLSAAWSNPTIELTETVAVTESNMVILTFDLEGAEAAGYRFNWGDGSEYTEFYEPNDEGAIVASHTFAACQTYTVWVEAVDVWGNHTVDSFLVDASEACDEGSAPTGTGHFLPMVHNMSPAADGGVGR